MQTNILKNVSPPNNFITALRRIDLVVFERIVFTYNTFDLVNSLYFDRNTTILQKNSGATLSRNLSELHQLEGKLLSVNAVEGIT